MMSTLFRVFGCLVNFSVYRMYLWDLFLYRVEKIISGIAFYCSTTPAQRISMVNIHVCLKVTYKINKNTVCENDKSRIKKQVK